MGEGEPNYHLTFRLCLAEYNDIILNEFSSVISDLNDTSVAIRYCLCCLNDIIWTLMGQSEDQLAYCQQ